MKNSILILVAFLSTSQSFASSLALEVKLRDLTRAVDLAIRADYKKNNVRKSVGLYDHTLETVRERQLTDRNGNKSTVTEFDFGVATSYVRDQDSGVPDWCSVTVIKSSTALRAKHVACSPYD
ncbi:MAG: hypothetical protein AB7F59_00800 [Bdellovibrionales bacterium]